MAGPKLPLPSQAWGRHSDVGRGAAVWKRELGSVPCPQRSESEGSGRQSRTGAFYSLLSNPYRFTEWEPQLSTRFLALVSKWKSEQEQINTGAEPFGAPARGQSPPPSVAASPIPTQQLISEAQALQQVVRSIPIPQPQLCQAAAKRGAESSSTSGDRSEGQAASGARLGKQSGTQVCAGRALHSQPSWERAGRGAAGRGQEGSESWPEWPLTQCLEACEGRQQRSRLPFSVLGEKHWDQPGGPCVAITSPRTKTPAPAREPGSLTPSPPSQDAGGYPEGSFSKLRWDPEARTGGPLLHPGPCAPPPTPRQFGAQREHSNSFRRTQRIRRGYCPACESRKLT